MKFLSLVIISFLVSPAFAEDLKPFVYDAHGKRDPLVPLVSPTGTVVSYDSDLTMNDLSLEGIVADSKGHNVAILNGKMVKPQDTIGPYVIDVIAEDHVELLKSAERFILKLKKGRAS